ncbi:MAG: 4Fe-4S binding protein [candidate division Zixibacteria bacterium]|nr:4Fe-4S binding protein [candidate division Zixibacteria bacterium]
MPTEGTAVRKPQTISANRRTVPNTEKPVQKTRLAVQIAFAALCIWIGVEFHFFVQYLESAGQVAAVTRPPGVEGFLPISSLMSLYYFILTGSVHAYHPAGLFILFAVILISLVFGKAFCSWLCPVGLLSEMLGDIGEKLFGRRLRLPRWLDYTLRSLKYLLLAFFVYSIFFLMNEVALRAFLDSPYNLVSDVKMYYFFADISRLALIIIGVLFLLSIFIRNFWCRFLCPYGALLGLCSLLSPQKIKRNPISCIDCGKCALACPSSIKVDKVRTVYSDECTTCLNCVDVCPVATTLELRSSFSKQRINKRWVAIGVVSLFLAVTGFGMFTGDWQNNVPAEVYVRHQDALHTYGHPTSTKEISALKAPAEKQEAPPEGHKSGSPENRTAR